MTLTGFTDRSDRGTRFEDVTPEQVEWCYREILGRPPENEAVIDQHLAGTRNFQSLILKFIRSKEFRTKKEARQGGPLDGPPMTVDLDIAPAQLAELQDRIRGAWTALGNERPHHSVLSSGKFLPQNLSANMGEFWLSGQHEASVVRAMLARHGFVNLATKTCVEYGCGIGRVTVPLASIFGSVHAYDISPSHLELANQRIAACTTTNVFLHLCTQTPIGQNLEPCDFLYSRIVLQHNPPPIMMVLIRSFLEVLRPGGIAIFQLPTYGADYWFDINEYLRREPTSGMEMHCLPQSTVFRLGAEADAEILEVREDGATGGHLGWISNTFIVRRKSSIV